MNVEIQTVQRRLLLAMLRVFAISFRYKELASVPPSPTNTILRMEISAHQGLVF
jgi:hypothetical protein